MKQTEIAALVMVASVSVIIAYFVASNFLGSPGEEKVSVKTINEITADIVEPDASIFNEDAINPTVEVVIGENSSP